MTLKLAKLRQHLVAGVAARVPDGDLAVALQQDPRGIDTVDLHDSVTTCHHRERKTAPARSCDQGERPRAFDAKWQTPEGLDGMTGGMAEWCLDVYGETLIPGKPGRRREGFLSRDRIIRGGFESAAAGIVAVPVTHRGRWAADADRDFISFRLVLRGK
jgi:formylglycine-generating enzyme required for sulfatase activity